MEGKLIKLIARTLIPLILLGNLTIELAILVILIILVRIFFLIHKIATGHTKGYEGPKRNSAKTLICIGSGGHTTEMLALLKNVDFKKYSPRYYIIASSDTTSDPKVTNFEAFKEGKNYTIYKIPRSRKVHQSYFSSILSTMYAIIYCVPILFIKRPNLILCNGPGTCIPVCVVAFLLKSAFICDTKIVFIESFCRTKSFSLTGQIMIYLADNILVQWPLLKRKLRRAEYIGQLM